ncbi:hypothetical protein HDU91_004758 [Kappamyces sp. JEL0680]|nr:hypothetical protein HDU91_004758 [Kappamyces sp. JEL0680]
MGFHLAPCRDILEKIYCTPLNSLTDSNLQESILEYLTQCLDADPALAASTEASDDKTRSLSWRILGLIAYYDSRTSTDATRDQCSLRLLHSVSGRISASPTPTELFGCLECLGHLAQSGTLHAQMDRRFLLSTLEAALSCRSLFAVTSASRLFNTLSARCPSDPCEIAECLLLRIFEGCDDLCQSNAMEFLSLTTPILATSTLQSRLISLLFHHATDRMLRFKVIEILSVLAKQQQLDPFRPIILSLLNHPDTDVETCFQALPLVCCQMHTQTDILQLALFLKTLILTLQNGTRQEQSQSAMFAEFEDKLHNSTLAPGTTIKYISKTFGFCCANFHSAHPWVGPLLELGQLLLFPANPFSAIVLEGLLTLGTFNAGLADTILALLAIGQLTVHSQSICYTILSQHLAANPSQSQEKMYEAQLVAGLENDNWLLQDLSLQHLAQKQYASPQVLRTAEQLCRSSNRDLRIAALQYFKAVGGTEHIQDQLTGILQPVLAAETDSMVLAECVRLVNMHWRDLNHLLEPKLLAAMLSHEEYEVRLEAVRFVHQSVMQPTMVDQFDSIVSLAADPSRHVRQETADLIATLQTRPSSLPPEKLKQARDIDVSYIKWTASCREKDLLHEIELALASNEYHNTDNVLCCYDC